jgi:hypothetical protein
VTVTILSISPLFSLLFQTEKLFLMWWVTKKNRIATSCRPDTLLGVLLKYFFHAYDGQTYMHAIGDGTKFSAQLQPHNGRSWNPL